MNMDLSDLVDLLSEDQQKAVADKAFQKIMEGLESIEIVCDPISIQKYMNDLVERVLDDSDILSEVDYAKIAKVLTTLLTKSMKTLDPDKKE